VPAPSPKAAEAVAPANPPPAPPATTEAAKTPVEKPTTAAVTQPAAPPADPAPKPLLASAAEAKPAQAAPVKAASVPLPPPPPTPVARAIEAPKLAFGPKPTFEPASLSLAPGSAQTARPLVGSSNHLATAPSGAAPTPRASASMPPAPVPPAVVANPGSPLVKERSLVAMPAAPRDVAAAATKAMTNAASGVATADPGAAASAALAVASAEAAVTAPAGSILGQKTALLAGILLATAALGFGWLALRRSRAPPHGSLITRSLDHGTKRPVRRQGSLSRLPHA
jgi:hypothetical protein